MFRCENICKGPETVGNRWSMYHIAPTIPIAAKLQQMYLAGSMLPWKQPYGFIASPVWSGSFTQVTTAIHPNDRAVHLGDGTDGALFLHGYCRKYTRITYPIWQPASDELASARKNEKNTLWGYRKFCHCILLYISTIRWRNKNIAVRKQKITVRKVLSDYNLTTKMDMPGRQTFWEPGICNDIMCHAKEAVCILF